MSTSSRVALIAVGMLAVLLAAPAADYADVQTRRLVPTEITQLPAKSKRFALVIGVDEYQDTQITRLDGAANDAKALADALVRYAGFDQRNVILMATDQPLERQPTRGNILRRLSNLRGIVPEDGLLVVAFSGHGIERGGRAYLCPSDAQLSGDIALLEDTAINVETMKERIKQTRVGQVLILLDACRNNPEGRGGDLNPLSDNYARSFNFDVRNREVSAFATLYATSVGNVAYEYKEKKQGYFTWALIEGLRGAAANDKGEVTLAGLRKYVEDTVPRQVSIDLGQEKRQRPFAVVEGYKSDELVIAVVERRGDVGESEGAPPGGRPLRNYGFETVTLNFRGDVTARKPREAAQYVEELGGGVTLEMVAIPGGTFMMGSPENEAGRNADEGPQRQVTLPSFYMGKYEVTQAQWRAVARLPRVVRELNADPSHFKGDDLPVEQVLWEDAMEFCARLSRATGREYRLPSESEWEYAGRAGSATPFHLGETITHGFVNFNSTYPYASAPRGLYRSRTTAVGSLKGGVASTVDAANGFGLYDMHGNVWEWCADPWHVNYRGAPTDGSVWEENGDGASRVVRGGAWNARGVNCRAASRGWVPLISRNSNLGFRIVSVERTR